MLNNLTLMPALGNIGRYVVLCLHVKSSDCPASRESPVEEADRELTMAMDPIEDSLSRIRMHCQRSS
jgi:hypothetical protein